MYNILYIIIIYIYIYTILYINVDLNELWQFNYVSYCNLFLVLADDEVGGAVIFSSLFCVCVLCSGIILA